jgi:hypothetical protein
MPKLQTMLELPGQQAANWALKRLWNSEPVTGLER